MRKLSVIIPCHNKAETIGRCLKAALASDHPDFEVIVVDDGSTDDSVGIIREYSCKAIVLKEQAGASKARNTGAQNSSGDLLFFTDADCLLEENTLSRADQAMMKEGDEVIMGGTYTAEPFDQDFFSRFQSIFVNYSETKDADDPDYIATHAMVVSFRTFKEIGGFPEDFLPIIEDVEFSHRARKAGYRLMVLPGLKVKHIFDFSLVKSVKNAYVKSRYWTMYSLGNRDLFRDSGCASSELKINVPANFFILLFIFLSIMFQTSFLLFPVAGIFILNFISSRKLLIAFYKAKGIIFAGLALLYWMLLYPIPVGLGGLSGLKGYFFKK